MIDFEHLKEWFVLSDSEKRERFEAIKTRIDLNLPAIEKDW